MSCCTKPVSPHVVRIGDVQSLGGTSARLLTVPSKSPYSDPETPRTQANGFVRKSPSSELKSQVQQLGHRQENLFKHALEQQEKLWRHVVQQQERLESRLCSIQSASKANADAQEHFLCEFRKLSSTLEALDVAHVMKTNAHGQLGTAQTGTESNSGARSNGLRASLELAPEIIHPAKAKTEESLQSSERSRPTQVSIVEDATFQNTTNSSNFRSETMQTVGETMQTVSTAKHGLTVQGSMKSAIWSNFDSNFLRLQRVSMVTGDTSRRTKLRHLLQTKEFELLVAGAIMLNAIAMAWESQYQGLGVGFELEFPGRELEADVVWAGFSTVLTVTDWLFGLVFLVEMLVKLYCFRFLYFYDSRYSKLEHAPFWKRFYDNLCGWNLLDFCSVVAFLVDKLLVSVSGINPQMLRLLRLFRLFRLVRLLRFLESLDHLYIMTTAIAGLTKVLFWAVTLLTLILLICNLCVVQILQVTYFDGVSSADLTERSLAKHHQIYEYFGTCTRCMLTMFEITLGNWPPVARLLQEEVSEWFALFCIVHKLTIGFSVVGVITGVILQETFKVAQTDDIIMLRQKKKASKVLSEKMKQLFDALDISCDRKLNLKEFQRIGDDPSMKLWMEALDVATDDLPALFDLLDADSNGYVTLDELIARIPRVRGAARSVDMLKLMNKFIARVSAAPLPGRMAS